MGAFFGKPLERGWPNLLYPEASGTKGNFKCNFLSENILFINKKFSTIILGDINSQIGSNNC